MNFNLQPYLSNDVVAIRPLEQLDFDALYGVVSDPLIWQQHQNKDRYTLDNFTTFFKESIASKGAMAIIDAETEKIIGSSRFKIIDESAAVVEIGWSLLSRAYWGGHYNRAFKKLMVNHALEHNRYVIFYVNPKNFRSQKAMEKLGAIRMTFPEKPWVLKENIGITYAISSPLAD